MKIQKLDLICVLTLAAALLFGSANVMAQQAGFRAGIAPGFPGQVLAPGFGQPVAIFPGNAIPGSFAFPPAQASAFVRHRSSAITSSFAFNPYGSYAYPAPTIVVPGQPLIVPPAPPVQIIVNNGIATIVSPPGQVFVPTQVFVPHQAIVPIPVIPQVPPAHFVSRGRRVRMVPPMGTHRADVLRLLGQPSVSVVTRDVETLHFSGGLTVIIQNGQVAGPK
jgi:hypothetical protein